MRKYRKPEVWDGRVWSYLLSVEKTLGRAGFAHSRCVNWLWYYWMINPRKKKTYIYCEKTIQQQEKKKFDFARRLDISPIRETLGRAESKSKSVQSDDT